mmetsp:Transcript_8240/g.25427  ORF Transcript_8240/g.25427 Transcript_8240/m.25427 type:complete len:213 (-) Transcript_8240:309-947(-)
MSSVVMLAWRPRLKMSVSFSSISLAFLEDESMAFMRAPFSDVEFSRAAFHMVVASCSSTRSCMFSSKPSSNSYRLSSSCFSLAISSGEPTVAMVGLFEMMDLKWLKSTCVLSNLPSSRTLSAIIDTCGKVMVTFAMSPMKLLILSPSLRSSCALPFSPITTIELFDSDCSSMSAREYLTMVEFTPPHRPLSDVKGTSSTFSASASTGLPKSR